MTTPSFHRIPYVGDGADGCRRSAEIDRNEADTVDASPPGRRDYLLGSAARWIQQAEYLEAVEQRDTRVELARDVLAEMERHAPMPDPTSYYAIKLRAALGVPRDEVLTCRCGAAGCEPQRGGPVPLATTVEEYRRATPDLAGRCSRCGHSHDEEYECELDCVTCGIAAERSEP